MLNKFSNKKNNNNSKNKIRRIFEILAKGYICPDFSISQSRVAKK
ncbi:MAG: hypothetical protein AB1782_05690 [Cyanobacteriota bacterium]